MSPTDSPSSAPSDSPNTNPTNNPSADPTEFSADNPGEDKNDVALKAVATVMGMLIAALAVTGGLFRFWKNRDL